MFIFPSTRRGRRGREGRGESRVIPQPVPRSDPGAVIGLTFLERLRTLGERPRENATAARLRRGVHAAVFYGRAHFPERFFAERVSAVDVSEIDIARNALVRTNWIAFRAPRRSVIPYRDFSTRHIIVDFFFFYYIRQSCYRSLNTESRFDYTRIIFI